MASGLKRIYGFHHLHFITFSCHRRRQYLRTGHSRDVFLRILEETRHKYEFVVDGYVVMPEHVHLLLSEPKVGDLSKAILALKQRTSKALLPKRKRRKKNQLELFPQGNTERHFWQKRFYDFNVFSMHKRTEKLRYMHRNPVKRGLVQRPGDWEWSSYRAYADHEEGIVKIFTEVMTYQAKQDKNKTVDC